MDSGRLVADALSQPPLVFQRENILRKYSVESMPILASAGLLCSEFQIVSFF